MLSYFYNLFNKQSLNSEWEVNRHKCSSLDNFFPEFIFYQCTVCNSPGMTQQRQMNWTWKEWWGKVPARNNNMLRMAGKVLARNNNMLRMVGKVLARNNNFLRMVGKMLTRNNNMLRSTNGGESAG